MSGNHCETGKGNQNNRKQYPVKVSSKPLPWNSICNISKNPSLACGQGVSAGQPPALGARVMFRATVMQPRPHPPAYGEGRWWLVGSMSHLIKGGANPCKSHLGKRQGLLIEKLAKIAQSKKIS